MRRFDVYLNGQSLNSVYEAVYIIDVQENAPKLRVEAGDNAKYDGLRFLGRAVQTRTVTVIFAVRERNMARRAEIIDAVLDWVADGTLQVNYRPNQQLRVKYTDMPAGGSALQWADAVSVGFTAYDPYWEAVEPTTASLSTSGGTAKKTTLQPVGTADTTFLEFDIKNAGAGTMNTATISVNGRSFSFTSLGLAVGQTLSVAYDQDGYLLIRIGNASAMNKRTGTSDDDLILYQRKPNEVTVTTGAASSVTLKATGRYR